MENDGVEMSSGTKATNDIALTSFDPIDVKSLIYVMRNQQVMLDSDLAMLYDVETKVFNQAVRRNENRFPERFRFRLTSEEHERLRSQTVTSNGRGGRRYLPYVFTEQGIAMLSTVLRSDIAVETSIRIMDAFVETRRFLANNAALFERIGQVELRQLEYQKETDKKLDQVFACIDSVPETTQRAFFDGQLFDAFSLLVELIQKAQYKIVLIDSYVDVSTLNILAKKATGATVTIHTLPNTRSTQTDIDTFNFQYPALKVHHTRAFHDRFLIIDDSIGYHIGASLKDAGRKCFAITKIQDAKIVEDILDRLKKA
ncbi:ORF6N domain-containing protein [Paraeggerthella sp. Marseille-Q4926]|uniref:ORF6N domain-containing protein n=1 Tax=Paraeggerthella sp. Marseille-Q4926 TaxID=2866587 RepID=UPI001CE4ACB6|nr:ORF6N domain-containing protein [Paraeggerthella sp. Marseille-Q4926]